MSRLRYERRELFTLRQTLIAQSVFLCLKEITMSIKLMAQVFDIDLGNPVRKLVMLKLADNADDNGNAFQAINI